MESNVRIITEQAFIDLIKSRLQTIPPDFDMLKYLYIEIRDRLCSIIPNRSDLHQEIKDSLDVDIFIQCIKNDAFSVQDMRKLVLYCFGKIKEYEAPVRNETTDKILGSILTELDKPVFKFSDIVPIFILEFNKKLDEIEQDIVTIKNKIQRLISTGSG